MGFPDFYADGIYEWAFPEEIAFDEPVLDATFSFWAIFDGINGGAGTGVSLDLLDANGDPVGAPVFPTPLKCGAMDSMDPADCGPGAPIAPEDLTTIASATGIYGIRFNVAAPPDAAGEGYGIDALSVTPVPEPSAASALGAMFLGLIGLARRRG